MRDYQFTVDVPHLDEAGWWFRVEGTEARRYGPFATEDDARDHRESLFTRWNRAARQRNGWAWKSTHRRWHVTVPEGVEVRAPRLRSAPCSVHEPLTTRSMSPAP